MRPKININKDVENLKRNQKENLKLKSTITEMKNSLQGFKGRFAQAEESVNLKIGEWELQNLKNRKKKD